MHPHPVIMRTITGIIFVATMMLLQGCPWYGYKYDVGVLPSIPVNFSEINTEYDDYNSTAPSFGEAFPLCFSSTRNSGGGDFDIVYKLITIDFSRVTGELSIREETHSNYDVVISNAYLHNALMDINTSHDELGPFLIETDERIFIDSIGQYYQPYVMLFSNDENGNQDILLTHSLESRDFADPVPVHFLNSDADDGYPCFNFDRSSIYFSSSREGDFNIFSAITTGAGDEPMEILCHEGPLPIEKDTILSSNGDDKCPYMAYHTRFSADNKMSNNLLVFASNREGGYGGFDLYYSRFRDGKWEEPVNFGVGINTEYDEYRPIVRPLGVTFTSEFMLFSSNRPGGLGGFDLYYVGIDKIGDPVEW